MSRPLMTRHEIINLWFTLNRDDWSRDHKFKLCLDSWWLAKWSLMFFLFVFVSTNNRYLRVFCAYPHKWESRHNAGWFVLSVKHWEGPSYSMFRNYCFNNLCISEKQSFEKFMISWPFKIIIYTFFVESTQLFLL